jgi:hypothetical protein
MEWRRHGSALRPMRDYAIAHSRFWTGDTGKLLRRLGRDYQVVGFYLFTCHNANMIGLYYLPLPTLCHEVGGLTLEGASKVLRSHSGVMPITTASQNTFLYRKWHTIRSVTG